MSADTGSPDHTFHRFSWPEHGSGNAWLVYDVNDDGLITNGKELFGNFTPHSDGGVPNHPSPNGFLALAWYDKPAQGGNWDGIIDKQDAIWNHLKLWIDDHCYKTPNAPCTSVPSEVHSLASAGVRSISLVYQLNPANDDTDAYGNELKIYVPLNVADGRTNQKSTDPRVAYDVFFRVEISKNVKASQNHPPQSRGGLSIRRRAPLRRLQRFKPNVRSRP
jgi:hypothetical protein